MPKLVLTYFDFDGSRGEAARLAMHLAGIAFEDKRIARSDWPALRDAAPYQSLPILEVDGKVIAQSNTINRYVGKLAGLYPKDDWQAAVVDELMDAVEDITYKIGNTFALEGEAKKKAREALAAGPIPRFLKQFEARLKRRRRRVVRRKAPDRRRPQVLPVCALAEVRGTGPYSCRHRGQAGAAPGDAPGAGQEPAQDRGLLRGARAPRQYFSLGPKSHVAARYRLIPWGRS